MDALKARLDVRTSHRQGKKRKKPLYSIVIVVHELSDDFAKLLSSLKTYEDSKEFEIVVVSNGIADLEAHVPDEFENYILAEPGLNCGCSLGRNIGAECASGKYLVFVDDDGVLGDGAIDSLIATIETYDAVAVRGRVVPRTPDSFTPPHYDRGELVVPSIPDAEGISVWARDAFLRFGGFDPLLAGHEGLHLMCRMFRFYGPFAFLYAPEAVLHHDYNSSETALRRKTRRQAHNRRYLDHCGLDWEAHIGLMDRVARDSIAKAMFSMAPVTAELAATRSARRTLSNDGERVSVITTARNASAFLEDYTASLKNQTHRGVHAPYKTALRTHRAGHVRALSRNIT